MKLNTYLAPEVRTIASVKVAIANPAGDYLLLTRASSDKNRPDTADLPGGGVDAGESPWEACFREVNEELGIKLRAEQLQQLHRLEGLSFFGHINARYFGLVVLEEIPDLTLNPAEHSAGAWYPRDEVYRRLTHLPLKEGFAQATGIFDVDLA